MAEPLDLHCATACDFAASIVLLLTSDPMETPCFATSEGNPIATAPAATQESTWAKINVNIIAPRIILYCIYPLPRPPQLAASCGCIGVSTFDGITRSNSFCPPNLSTILFHRPAEWVTTRPSPVLAPTIAEQWPNLPPAPRGAHLGACPNFPLRPS